MIKTQLRHYNDRVHPFALAPSQVPLVTRREQNGTDEATLEANGGKRKKRAPEDDAQPPQPKKVKGRGKGRGKGKGKGRGKGKSVSDGSSPTKTSPMKRPSTSRRTMTPKKMKTTPKASPKSRAAKAKASSKSKPGKKTKKPEEGESKEARTWGGRWIPTEEGVPLLKFQAVRQVFNENIAGRVKAQSSFQSPFFKLCQQAFRSLNANDASYADYVACAKRQVEKFLSEENVRNCANYDVLIFFVAENHPTTFKHWFWSKEKKIHVILSYPRQEAT